MLFYIRRGWEEEARLRGLLVEAGGASHCAQVGRLTTCGGKDAVSPAHCHY